MQKVEENPGEADDDEIFFDPDLFIDRSYVEMTYEFNDVQVPLMASKAASTDYDLTGQIVWPVSVYLSWFMVHNRTRFADCHVLELGAGCGLAGFAAAQISRKVTITDGNDIVIDLLSKTKELTESRGLLRESSQVQICPLLWGKQQELTSLIQHTGAPDVIIGADVICWPNFIAPLLETIRHLLRMNPSAVCFIGYVCRALTTTQRLHDEARRFHLRVQECEEDFLPDPRPDNVTSARKLELLQISLDNDHNDDVDTNSNVNHTSNTATQWWQANTPC